MTTELDVQRRLTQAFIDTMPVHLVLTPRVQVRTDTGGLTWEDGEPKPAQKLRLVEMTTLADNQIRTGDGSIIQVDFELLGPWDADIDQWDTFTLDADVFEVREMYYDNGWETRAKVVRFGG